LKLGGNLALDSNLGKQGMVRVKTKTEIIEAKPSHAKHLNVFLQEIFATSEHLNTSKDEFRMTTWQRRRWLAKKNVNPVETCLLAMNNGEIVGMIDCWTDRRQRVTHSTGFVISVKKGWRCKGVGTVMLRRFIGWVKANSTLKRIELHVHSDNTHAIKLYETFGFELEGVCKRVIWHDDGRIVDDHIMALWP